MMYSVYKGKNGKYFVARKPFGFCVCREFINAKGQERFSTANNTKVFDNLDDCQAFLDGRADYNGWKWCGTQDMEIIQNIQH